MYAPKFRRTSGFSGGPISLQFIQRMMHIVQTLLCFVAVWYGSILFNVTPVKVTSLVLGQAGTNSSIIRASVDTS